MLPLFCTITFVYSETSYVPSALMKQGKRKRREDQETLKGKTQFKTEKLAFFVLWASVVAIIKA